MFVTQSSLLSLFHFISLSILQITKGSAHLSRIFKEIVNTITIILLFFKINNKKILDGIGGIGAHIVGGSS